MFVSTLNIVSMVTQTHSLRLRHNRHNVKVHSHRAKANIFSGVCRLFFDIFACRLIFSLSRSLSCVVNRPLKLTLKQTQKLRTKEP